MSWQFFALGTFFGLIFTILSIKFFPRFGLLDFPERYGLMRAKIAYPGGLVLSILALGLAFFDSALIWPAILSFLLLVISFLDDKNPIPAKFRFALQLLILTGVIFSGVQIDFIGNPFSGSNIELGDFPIISIGITLAWLLLIQNSINFIDGIKGVSVGISGLGFLILGLLGTLKPELFLDPSHTAFSSATLYLAGLCCGAFWFYAKGKIILGDSGSQVLGFWLGVLSIVSGAKVATTLLVLGVPIIDALITIFRRVIIEKRKPWHGDQRHLHHLLANRYGERLTLIILLLLSISFGVVALFATMMGKFIGILILLVIILLLWGSAYRFYAKNNAL